MGSKVAPPDEMTVRAQALDENRMRTTIQVTPLASGANRRRRARRSRALPRGPRHRDGRRRSAVITVDRIDRVADAVHTGCRSLRIARQSVLAGMGLSLAAMGVAAAGYLPRRRRGDSRRSSCGSHRVLIEQWCNRRMSESPRARWVVRR